MAPTWTIGVPVGGVTFMGGSFDGEVEALRVDGVIAAHVRKLDKPSAQVSMGYPCEVRVQRRFRRRWMRQAAPYRASARSSRGTRCRRCGTGRAAYPRASPRRCDRRWWLESQYAASMPIVSASFSGSATTTPLSSVPVKLCRRPVSIVVLWLQRNGLARLPALKYRSVIDVAERDLAVVLDRDRQRLVDSISASLLIASVTRGRLIVHVPCNASLDTVRARLDRVEVARRIEQLQPRGALIEADPDLDEVRRARHPDRRAVDAAFVVHAVELRDRVLLLLAVPLDRRGDEVPRERPHGELVAAVDGRHGFAAFVIVLSRLRQIAEEARQVLAAQLAQRRAVRSCSVRDTSRAACPAAARSRCRGPPGPTACTSR